MNLYLFSKRKSKTGVLFIGVLIIISSFCFSTVSNAEGLNQKIDLMVEKFMTKGKIPAVAVLVTKKGEIIHQKSYGKADIGHNINVTNDSAFAIGSITKQFTGLAIAQLISRGTISLDDPLHKYFPDYPQTAKIITVRNLLNHTSGIVNYTTKPIVHENAWKDLSHEEMIAWFKDEPLVFDPGTRWNYTNSGIYLLGVIIEKTTGLTYEAYLQQNIFTPFGMTRTYLAGSQDIVPSRVTGYDLMADGYKISKSYSATFPYAAGAIISTTGDLWKFLNNIHNGDLVSEEIRKIIYRQETLPNEEELIYTLGCFFVGDLEGHKTYFHGGQVYGFSSHQAYFPEDDVTVIILTNRMGYSPGPSSLSQKISREVMGIAPPKVSKQRISKDEIAKITGTYHLTGHSFFHYNNIIISFKGETMMLKMGPSVEKMVELPFYNAGNGQFIMVDDDEMTFNVDLSVERPIAYLNSGTIQFKLKQISK